MHIFLQTFALIPWVSPVTAADPGGQSGGSARRSVPELRLAAGVFHPTEGTPAAPDGYASGGAETSLLGRRYLVAVADSDLEADEKHRLEQAGAEVLDYLPVHGYRLRASPGAEARVRALPFVRWLGPLPLHFKVDTTLLRRAAGSQEAATLRVILEAGEPVTRVLEATSGLDPVPAPSGKDGAWRVLLRAPAGRLTALLPKIAALPEVEAIEEARPLRLFNQDAVWVHQSFVGPSPQQTPIFDHGIFGCGQIVGIADSGQDYDLCFFRDTVNGPPPIATCNFAPCLVATPNLAQRKDILYYNWSGTSTGDDDTCPALLGASGHGTHTSGSIAGDMGTYADCAGFTSPGRTGGDGLAPGAKLVIEEMGDGLEFLNNRAGTLYNLAEVAYLNGARIHSNSWGGACFDIFGSCIPGCTMPYDSLARDADLAMWTYPDLLIVLAAGNAGLFCPPPIAVGTPAVAKSPIVVGSVGHGVNAVQPSDFSSPGPVFDGRLKPTVAAQGEATVSAASDAFPQSNNCSTCSLDGTSMATPITSGLAALVREYYVAGFLEAGARSPAQGILPSAALLKATLLDASVPLDALAPGPDFRSGYGRIQLDRTLAFAGSPFALRVDDNRTGLTTGGIVTHAYDVAAGTPLRATLVWTDFPAALNAASARVNELQLEVIDPAGTLWSQTLDSGTGLPVQTAYPSESQLDTLNVEERLVFDSPAPGRWVVRVRGMSVPMGPQPFALLVRGALTDCPAPAGPQAPSLSIPGNNQVQISWSAVAGASSYDVYRTLGACGAVPGVPIATGVGGTSFLDTLVSGGVTYSYYVTAASDISGLCESPRSPCASIVPTGDCFLAPAFAGLTMAASSGQGTCGVDLSWVPATLRCGADVRYNVYRSTDPLFTPSPANRIARCVIGTSYRDTAGLAQGTDYYYTVRAEDATSGHGGACRGGNEDTNLVHRVAAPYGPSTIDEFRDDAGDTGSARFSAPFPWSIQPSGGQSGPRVYRGDSSELICADLTSPILTLDSPGTGPQLFFATLHDLDYDAFGSEGSVGQVEIATGPGFSNWTRVELTPDYPTTVLVPFNLCATTGASETYFSGTSATYTTYSASLADWAGGDVLLRFHLSGDLFLPAGHWLIDDVRITHVVTPGSCTSLPLGPPPVPDGAAVPGQPVRVSPGPGGQLAVSWDAARCPADAVNLYYGTLGSFQAFTGGVCNLPPTGSAMVTLPDNAWFLVVSTDGASTDGSYSRDLNGAERSYGGASLACPSITRHLTNNDCP